MAVSDVTCWTMIRGAAEGNVEDRDRFARRYLPVLRIYLRARWRRTPTPSATRSGSTRRQPTSGP